MDTWSGVRRQLNDDEWCSQALAVVKRICNRDSFGKQWISADDGDLSVHMISALSTVPTMLGTENGLE